MQAVQSCGSRCALAAPAPKRGRSRLHEQHPSWRRAHPRRQSGPACRVAAPARAETANGAPAGQAGSAAVLGESEELGVSLQCDESGCVMIVSKDMQQLDEDSAQGVLQCNVTGCFYGPPPAGTEFTVLEGNGWRLGFETVPDSEDSFSAMVGAGGWSIALTASEFNDFCKLIQMLRKGLITMDKDGVLGKDNIVMQVEVGSMWMECVVPKKVLPNLQKFLKFGAGGASSAFEIRFILTGKLDKRQAEGYWPADAVMDMLRKIDELTGARTPVPAGQVAVSS